MQTNLCVHRNIYADFTLILFWSDFVFQFFGIEFVIERPLYAIDRQKISFPALSRLKWSNCRRLKQMTV